MAGYIWFKTGEFAGEVTQGAKKGAQDPSPNGKDFKEYYHGWIELNSVQQTVTRAIETGRSGTARARAGCVLEEIEIEKEMDSTTVPLIKACSGGQAFDEVWIHLVTSIGEGEESLHPYLELRLWRVKVTRYNASGSGLDSGEIPRETMALNFDQITWKYWPIGLPDGPPNKVYPVVLAGWDILKQAPFAGK